MKTVEQEMSTTSGTAAVYTNTVYTNSIGQVLLTDLQDSNSNHWRTYRCYDPANRLLLTAEPSAVAGYALNAGNWDGYSPTAGSSGLVHETNYYATTTGSESIAGGAGRLPGLRVGPPGRLEPRPNLFRLRRYGPEPDGQRQRGGRTQLQPVLRAYRPPHGRHGRHRQRRHADHLSHGPADHLQRFERHSQFGHNV